MDAVHWERVQHVFHDAARLPAGEQRAFVESECGHDASAAADVLALLREDAAGDSLLDRGVAEAAHQLLVAPPSTLVSQRFGPYRIRRKLGEGGMGVVYLVERSDLGSVAAIKLLRDAWLSPARRERFATEQRTLATLNHPGIARLYDADTLADGTPWFVMEYVEGVPLTAYCLAHACSIPERLRLLAAVCDAVRHAHQHAVIHRDLKPSNILVTPDGEVKLLDFGIAKQLDSLDNLDGPGAPSEQTQSGVRMMTPAYAAPEQLRHGRIGVHTDVYALGVVLYELLVGRVPFELSTLTPGEAETMIVEQEPERPSVAARRMAAADAGGRTSAAEWADLDVLCLTAMHKDPQRRYGTVDAMVGDIQRYLHGEPLVARADSPRYRAGKFLRRNWRPVSAAAVVLVLLASIAVFYTVRLASARNAALAEAARTQRIQRFMLALFEGGDDAAGPADTLRVVALVGRGVQEARSLDGEPEVQAELYQTLGGIQQQLGDFDRADSLLRASLAQRRSLFGPEHVEVARSLIALGQLRVAQAEYGEGEQLIRDGLGMSRRTLPADHPEIARATTALGAVLEERGEYDAAIAVLDSAVRLHRTRGADTPDAAATMSELASAHFYAGHFAIADSIYQAALVLSRRLHGERHPVVADDLINLGAIQFEWGKYAEAERYYRQAFDIIRPWYGAMHYRTAANLTMLGRALVYQQRYDEASTLLRQALAIQERVYGPTHPRVASTMNELGTVALKQGRLDDAAARYARMEEIYRAVHGDRHYLIAIARSNLASVAMERREYAAAERIYRDVVARFTAAQSAEHLNTGIARVKLGRSLLRQRRPAAAEPELLAGYDILVKQTKAPVSWLEAARTDLVEVYEALGQPGKVARFRAELTTGG